MKVLNLYSQANVKTASTFGLCLPNVDLSNGNDSSPAASEGLGKTVGPITVNDDALKRWVLADIVLLKAHVAGDLTKKE